MACSPDDIGQADAEAGYATAAAAMIALALSVVVSAVVGASLTDLRASRAAMDRTRTETALDGALQVAIVGLLESGGNSRLRWMVPTPLGAVEVLAEPEAEKLALVTAADLEGGEFPGLGETDMAAIRPRLRALALSGGGAADVARLYGSPLWRACASSVISPYGRATSLSLSEAAAPATGRFSWRAGEVWRLRALSPDGWADDRIVRLTGDAQRPAAIVERVLVRGQRGGEPCRAIIESLG